MKKQLKWTAALSTAAIMTALTPSFSIPVMAQASGWVQENGVWMFYDEDGFTVTDTWKKHDGQWYYLDEDGELSFSRQVDEYYVDAEGKRVINQWVKVANDDDWDSEDAPEFYWYYYGKDGKALTSRFRTLNNETYYFDGNGRMVTGLAEIGGSTYYFGKSDDGTMKKGWVQLTDENTDDESSWHYFNSDGKMVQNEIDKRIAGSYYTFKDGKMQTGWFKMPEESVNTATASDASKTDEAANADEGADNTSSSDTAVTKAPAAGYQFYDNDGKRASGWRTIEGIPGVSQEEEVYKFYFKNGIPYFAENDIQLFSIGTSKYAFNTKGEMQTGLQTIKLEDGTSATFYFGTDGAMRTGKQTIYDEDEGIYQTWFFYSDGEKRGQGYHGIHDNVIYENGLRMQANADSRYLPVQFEGKNYLVNAAGTIQKATASSTSSVRPELGSGYRDLKDLSDMVWTVDINGILQ